MWLDIIQKRRSLKGAIWLLICLGLVNCFVPLKKSANFQNVAEKSEKFWCCDGQRCNVRMHVSGRGGDDNDESSGQYEDALARNRVRTNVLNFLSQRALQSFIFLLISCRDPHTVRWLETNYDFKNLENYHGTGALNLTMWPEPLDVLTDMMSKPFDVVVVSARRRGRGHGGWSKDNPYMEERFVEFEIDIDPPSLVSRILSIREQIAKEWEEDLDTIVMTNDMILASYHEKLVASRDDEECLLDSGSDQDPSKNSDCVSIEQLPTSIIDDQPTANRWSGPRTGKGAFDRNAMMMLSNAIDFNQQSSSPYRKGNFDLLCLLLTQESIHRVLREYRQAGDERELSFEWLREFYLERIGSHFDGEQSYGRAEDFLEELLTTPPSMKELEGGKLGLTDPLRVAEDIIRWRSDVALEWKEQVSNVPEDHSELRKVLWTKQMEKYMQPPSTSPLSSATDRTGASENNVGGFE